MDVLACPICKSFPLSLITFKTENVRTGSAVARCEYYCGYKKSMIDDALAYECNSCTATDVTEGILLCHACRRWYRITDSLPILLPDHLRDKDSDVNFLLKHRLEIDKDILEAWFPFHL